MSSQLNEQLKLDLEKALRKFIAEHYPVVHKKLVNEVAKVVTRYGYDPQGVILTILDGRQFGFKVVVHFDDEKFKVVVNVR